MASLTSHHDDFKIMGERACSCQCDAQWPDLIADCRYVDMEEEDYNIADNNIDDFIQLFGTNEDDDSEKPDKYVDILPLSDASLSVD